MLAIEVDGWRFHNNNPEQLARDELKDGICRKLGLKILRLGTTGSEEPKKIREALAATRDRWDPSAEG